MTLFDVFSYGEMDNSKYLVNGIEMVYCKTLSADGDIDAIVMVDLEEGKEHTFFSNVEIEKID